MKTQWLAAGRAFRWGLFGGLLGVVVAITLAIWHQRWIVSSPGEAEGAYVAMNAAAFVAGFPLTIIVPVIGDYLPSGDALSLSLLAIPINAVIVWAFIGHLRDTALGAPHAPTDHPGTQ